MKNDPPGGKSNRRTEAFALTYPGGDEAPRVSARGAGTLADQILKLAREHGVPVRQDETLAQLLTRIPVQQPVSPEMYTLVAELLAFLYEADKAWAERKGGAEWVMSRMPADEAPRASLPPKGGKTP